MPQRGSFVRSRSSALCLRASRASSSSVISASLWNETVDFVEYVAAHRRDAVQRVRVGFEQMRFAFGVDDRAPFERLQERPVIRANELGDGGAVLAVQ